MLNQFLPILSKQVRTSISSILVIRSFSKSAKDFDVRSSVSRGNFSKLQSEDVEYFQSIIRPEGVLTDAESIDKHNIDWLGKYSGSASLVLKPKTTNEVSKILKYCNERNLAVVPQGGNTGLVGGSVPVFDEIVLSTSSMTNIISFDEVSGILTCEAGCILEDLDQFLSKKDCMIPLDLGAKGTCQIGGNAATNAGGLRLLRYGSLHGSILGMEAVLPNGKILDCLSTMRKDNTGYDLKQLLIGSEGTLAVITKLSILTPPRPKSVNVALLGCNSFEEVKKTYVEAKSQLGEILSAVEFMDRESLDMVFAQQEWSKDPLESVCPFYVLIETSGSNVDHDMEKLDTYLEKVMGSGLVIDGTVAQDNSQARNLFQIREDITVALASRGNVYKYDVSLPMDQYYEIVEDIRNRVAPFDAQVVGYGHLGDCNLHLNISTLKPDNRVFEVLEPYVFEWTSKYRGSISAEHGIGTHKPQYLHLSKKEGTIEIMSELKKLFDPNGILNPYKVLPQDDSFQ